MVPIRCLRPVVGLLCFVPEGMEVSFLESLSLRLREEGLVCGGFNVNMALLL